MMREEGAAMAHARAWQAAGLAFQVADDILDIAAVTEARRDRGEEGAKEARRPCRWT